MKQNRLFSWNSFVFSVTKWMFEIWSVSSAFSKHRLYIWKFSVHVWLKPCLKDIEHYPARMLNKHNYMVVWTFFDNAFLWNWNENWPFLVVRPLVSFPNVLHIDYSTLTASSFRILSISAAIPSPPLALL